MSRSAEWMNETADQSLLGAQLAHKAAKRAEKDRQRVEELTPDPHREMVQALASQEQSALLRVGPRRNRWRDLDRFEEHLVELEQRREQLVAAIGAAREELNAEPGRHTASLADWLAARSEGERPASRVPELEHRLADLEAEYEATGSSTTARCGSTRSMSSATAGRWSRTCVRPSRPPPPITCVSSVSWRRSGVSW